VEVPPGSDVYTMDFDLRISVVSVATGHTLWPPDSAGGYTLHPDMGMVRDDPKYNAQGVRSECLQQLADQITKLFYEYRPGDEPAD